MAAGNFNLEDPGKQEAIRRGSHEYIPTAGKHGSYVPKPYKHQEYPKMMGKLPKPELKNFLTLNGVAIPSDVAHQQFQNALIEWDRAMVNSTVHSKTQETEWLRQNG